jgi:hypothetical protein
MRRCVLLLCLILLGGPALAQLGDLGVDPLRVESGCRPLGMGEAFTGLADDNNAIFYNPGGLAWAKGISFNFKDLDNIAALQAYPIGNGSSLGLAIVNEKLTINGGAAASSSSVVLLSYGTKLGFIPSLYQAAVWQRVGIGLSVKALAGETLRRSGALDRTATGWDIDLGILYKGTDWWSVGATGQNILPAKALGGGEFVWDAGSSEGIPAALKIGGSVKLAGDISSPYFIEGQELTLAGELEFSRTYSSLLRLGGEWGFDKKYFLRAGLAQEWRPTGVGANLSLGAGTRLDEWGADLAFYHDPLRDENTTAFSVSYYPKEWIVIRNLDVQRPSIELETALEKISLQDNAISREDRIEVSGRVKAGVDVYINGLRAATDADSNFRVIVPLQLAKNLIVVEARFEGEKKAWTYKVLREAKVEVAEEKALQREAAKAVTTEQKQAVEQKTAVVVAKRQKVEELVTLGVIEVTPEAEFKLEASITRGELAAWLAKSADLRLPRPLKDVTPDVKKDHPQAAFIKVVIDLKLMTTFPDGTFRPDSAVSREEGERLFKALGISQK